jgi:hypothetical protein
MIQLGVRTGVRSFIQRHESQRWAAGRPAKDRICCSIHILCWLGIPRFIPWQSWHWSVPCIYGARAALSSPLGTVVAATKTDGRATDVIRSNPRSAVSSGRRQLGAPPPQHLPGTLGRRYKMLTISGGPAHAAPSSLVFSVHHVPGKQPQRQQDGEEDCRGPVRKRS